MDFQTAISTCFNKYVDFSGRARRSEFWFFYLFYIIASFVLGIIDGLAGTDIFGNVGLLAMILPMLAASVRRMHDIGKSGWFILIPIYNIFLFATETNPNPNQWGIPAK